MTPEIRKERSGQNVFADLGLPHPEQELLKALFAYAKSRWIVFGWEVNGYSECAWSRIGGHSW